MRAAGREQEGLPAAAQTLQRYPGLVSARQESGDLGMSKDGADRQLAGTSRLRESNPTQLPRFAVWGQLRGHRGGSIDLSFVRVADHPPEE
jgi:hypothetical protein